MKFLDMPLVTFVWLCIVFTSYWFGYHCGQEEHKVEDYEKGIDNENDSTR